MSAAGKRGTATSAHTKGTALLLEAYLDGTLDQAGAVTLAGLLRAGGAPAAALRARLEFSGLLGQALDPVAAADVARAVGERLAAEGETSSFARRVARALPPRANARLPRTRLPRTRLPALAAAALVGAVALAGWWLAARGGEVPSWRVLAGAPGTQLLRAGAALPVSRGLALAPGDTLQTTGADTVRGADGSSLVLGPGSRLTIAAAGAGVRLEVGELEAEIAPQPAHRTLMLTTPQARVEVIGTRFTLAATPASTRLDLAHGSVRLVRLRDGAALELHAEQTATVADGTAFAAQALHPPAAVATAPSSTVATAAGEAPLFNVGLDGWWQQHGTWRQEGDLVQGDGGLARARLLSCHAYGDLVLTCRLRITDADRAEVQVGDYNWFVTVPAGAHQWIALRLVEQGDALSANADGVALAVEPGFGLAPRAGPLAFYVMRGRLEIADARIRTLAGDVP